MTAPISASFLERKLRAITGAQGSSILRTVGDLAGIVVVESDRPEYAFAGGEFYFGASMQRDPAAGQFAHIALLNPADSGVIVIVELAGHNGPQATYGLSVESAITKTTAGTRTRRDTRIPATGSPAAAQLWSWEAAAPLALGPYDIGAPSPNQYREPVILVAGNCFVIESNATDTLMNTKWSWRERAIEGGQLG